MEERQNIKPAILVREATDLDQMYEMLKAAETMGLEDFTAQVEYREDAGGFVYKVYVIYFFE